MKESAGKPGQMEVRESIGKESGQVSVIIIFLDCEKFLREAIESVLAQTYKSWELLLVDDGSTDAGTEIARSYAAKLPERVRYLEHPGHENRGMSASRNLGISRSEGRYIAFLDADDVWLSHKLDRQTAILKSHPEADMVCGPGRFWYSWTGIPKDREKEFMQNITVKTEVVFHPPALVPHFIRELNGPLLSSLLVRRKTAEDVGCFEELFRGMYEDQAFAAKLCLKSPVFVSGECWLKYRRRDDTSCSAAARDGLYHQSRAFYLNWLSDYLIKEGVTNAEVWKALRGQLWPYRHPFLHRMRWQGSRAKRKVKRICSTLLFEQGSD